MVDSGNSYGDKVSRLISWGHWFSFFNIIAAMLIGTRYIIQSEWPETFLGQLYLALSWIGHFGFLVFALYILILFPISFVIPSQRLMRLFGVLVGTTGMTVLLLDTQAYESIHLHLSPLVWELLLSGEKTEMNAKWQYLFIVVPIIFLLQLLLSEWVWKQLRKISHKHIGKPLSIIFFVCFVSSHLIHIWADANLYRPITAQRANFPLSYPMTAKSFMEKHGLLDKQEYQRLRESQGTESSEIIRYPIEPLSFKDQGKDYNLMMIMVDGLRSDMLASQTMPNLMGFAKNSINYRQHYSASNDMIGVFGLFYGLPGGYADSIRADGASPLLLSTLEKRGYDFGLFSGNNFSDPLYYQAIFTQPEAAQSHSEENKPEPTDARAIENWQSWLSKQDNAKPWFSYIELDSVANYEDSAELPEQFLPAEQNPAAMLTASYKNSTHYVDSLLATIFDSLENSEQLDNTVVIVTANHGMEFNETNTNSWGSNSNYSRYQLQVPLIIHWPNQTPSVVLHKTSHLDVVPTLMENLLSVNSPSNDYSSGVNLFDPKVKRNWLLAGDSREIVLITDQQTTVIDKFGNYKVYNQEYQRDKSAKPKLSLLMQGLSELKRFYHPED